MTERGQELFENFLREYCDNGYLYSGILPYDINYKNEYKELMDLGLIQIRNCDGFAYELSKLERRKLIINNNLAELWRKKASCFMISGKFDEIEKVMNTD